jgi:hypothetical protein
MDPYKEKQSPSNECGTFLEVLRQKQEVIELEIKFLDKLEFRIFKLNYKKNYSGLAMLRTDRTTILRKGEVDLNWGFIKRTCSWAYDYPDVFLLNTKPKRNSVSITT